MSNFQNPLNFPPVSQFSPDIGGPNHPGVSSMWYNTSVPPVGSPLFSATQPNQRLYHQGLAPNPQGYQQVTQSFPNVFIPPNAIPGLSNTLVHSPPVLTSPLSPTNSEMQNPFFLQNSQQQQAVWNQQSFPAAGEYLIEQNNSVGGGLGLTSPDANTYYLQQFQQQMQLQRMLLQHQEQLQQHQQLLLQQQKQQHPPQHQQHFQQLSGLEPPDSSQNGLASDNIKSGMALDSTHSDKHQEQALLVEGPNKEDRFAQPSTEYLDSKQLRHYAFPSSLPTMLNASLLLKHPMTIQSQMSLDQSSISTLSGGGGPGSWDGLKAEGQDDQTTSGRGSSISSSLSPPGSSPTSPHLGRTEMLWTDYVIPCYERPSKKDYCLRCNKKVYTMEQIGPIKDVLYHKMCFTCVTCSTKLNLKNFYHNPNDNRDLNVFCLSHKPKERTHSCDANAVHIKSALNAPRLDKVNEQIRTDRYHSEVLARAGYVQPSASARKISTENFYYGMSASEGEKPEPQHQQELQQLQQQHFHQHLMEADEKATIGKTTLSANGIIAETTKASPLPVTLTKSSEQLNQTDNLVDADGQELYSDIKKMDINSNNLKDFTTPLSHHSRNLFSEENLTEDLAIQKPKLDSHVEPHVLKLDSHVEQQVLKSNGIPTAHEKLQMDSQVKEHLVSNFSEVSGLASTDQSSKVSTYSDLPDGLPIKPMLSNKSRSADSLASDIDVILNDDLKPSGKCPPETRKVPISSIERSDRPSSSSFHYVITVPASQDTRVMATEITSANIAAPQPSSDPKRYLPKNEMMRMDRPSQYS